MMKTEMLLPSEAVLDKIAAMQKRNSVQMLALNGAITALDTAFPDRAAEMKRELEKIRAADLRLLKLDENYKALADSLGKGLRRISQVYEDHSSQAERKEAIPSQNTSDFNKGIYNRTLSETQYWQGIFGTQQEFETRIAVPQCSLEDRLALIPADKLAETVSLLGKQPDYPQIQTLVELRRTPESNAALLVKANESLAKLSLKFGAPAEEALLRMQPATVIAIENRLTTLESKSKEERLLEMLYLLRGFMPHYDGLASSDRATLTYLRRMDDNELVNHSRSIKEATEDSYLRILENGYGEKFDANPRIEGLEKASPLARIVVQIVLIENEKGNIEDQLAPAAAIHNAKLLDAVHALPDEIKGMFIKDISWLGRLQHTWVQHGQFSARMRGVMHSIANNLAIALSPSKGNTAEQIEDAGPMFELANPSTPQ
jgi:hypothetical protein